MNIYDIARLSGVSIATVSRVINNGSVSKKTRESVLKVIETTTFSPNVYARGLNFNSMKMIAVIVSDISDLHFAKAVSIIEKELKKNGYDLVLYCTGDEIGNTEKYIDLLMDKRTDGVVFIGSGFKSINKNPKLKSLAKDLPVILINAESSSDNMISIVNDDHAAIYETVKYLFGKGHKSFLYLYDTETASGLHKLEGFKSGLVDCGIALDKNRLIKCQRDIEKAKQAVKSFYHLNRDFTAIIASQDELAIGAIKAANELGLTIPGQMAITGYNDSILARSCTPELTSVDNKISTLCEISVKVLLDMLGKKPVSKKIRVDCELIERKTT